jgi:hypothetical protein
MSDLQKYISKPAGTSDSPLKQRGYVYAGWASFSVGFLGMFLPLLPTTVFWILAVWLWSRGSPELTAKVLSHPHFGKPVQDYLEHGVISAKGKRLAVTGMIIGYALFLWLGQPVWLLASSVAGVMALVALWIVSHRECPPA